MTPVRPSRFFGSANGTYRIAQEIAGEDVLGRIQPGDSSSRRSPRRTSWPRRDSPRTGTHRDRQIPPPCLACRHGCHFRAGIDQECERLPGPELVFTSRSNSACKTRSPVVRRVLSISGISILAIYTVPIGHPDESLADDPSETARPPRSLPPAPRRPGLADRRCRRYRSTSSACRIQLTLPRLRGHRIPSSRTSRASVLATSSVTSGGTGSSPRGLGKLGSWAGNVVIDEVAAP